MSKRPDQNFRLSADQFNIDPTGKVVINNDDIAEAIKYQQTAEVVPPEEAIKISIEIT